MRILTKAEKQIETEIVADELKYVVSSTEPDQPVEAHPVEAGTNVVDDVSSDLDRCPSPVHSECSSNVCMQSRFSETFRNRHV